MVYMPALLCGYAYLLHSSSKTVIPLLAAIRRSLIITTGVLTAAAVPAFAGCLLQATFFSLAVYHRFGRLASRHLAALLVLAVLIAHNLRRSWHYIALARFFAGHLRRD